MKIQRIYHNYKNWEDFKFGMYDTTCFMDEEPMIAECVNTLTCDGWLWEAMAFVSHNWIKSAEHNLTNIHRNRQAWLGQAACCFAHGAPEYITKKAWSRLTADQQQRANSVADKIMSDWESKHKIGYFNVKD